MTTTDAFARLNPAPREAATFRAPLPGRGVRARPLLVIPGGPDAALVPKRESTSGTPIVSPTREGLIVLRAPLRGLAWGAETEATLLQATCTQVKQ